MSILRDVLRTDGQPDMVFKGVTGRERLRTVTMHALRCDRCGSEVVFHRTQEVELPVGWTEPTEGGHRCPNCRTKRAVERDRKAYLEQHRDEARRLLAERGITDPYYVNLAMRMIGS